MGSKERCDRIIYHINKLQSTQHVLYWKQAHLECFVTSKYVVMNFCCSLLTIFKTILSWAGNKNNNKKKMNQWNWQFLYVPRRLVSLILRSVSWNILVLQLLPNDYTLLNSWGYLLDNQAMWLDPRSWIKKENMELLPIKQVVLVFIVSFLGVTVLS